MSTPDYFLSKSDTFIRLASAIYFQHEEANGTIDARFFSDTSSLLSITKLNRQTQVHSLYYLYLLVNHKHSLFQPKTKEIPFQTSSRNKLLSSASRKTFFELFELMVVLLMIANKANDDSSYTLKTWTNLTPVTCEVLKRKELIVLKKINYNAFLTGDDYMKWCTQLGKMHLASDMSLKSSDVSSLHGQMAPLPSLSPSLVLSDCPPTPNSPVSEIRPVSIQQPASSMAFKRSFSDVQGDFSYGDSKKLCPDSYIYPDYPNYSNGHLLKDNLGLNYNYNTDLNTPSSAASALYSFPSNEVAISSRQLPPLQLPTTQGRLKTLTYLQSPVHSMNCPCCAMTNMANSYFNSLKLKL